MEREVKIEQGSIPISMEKKNSIHFLKYVIVFSVLCFVTIGYVKLSYKSVALNMTYVNSIDQRILSSVELVNFSRVLVIYVYADTHSLSRSNLEFFIRGAVAKSVNVDYYIILQQLNRVSINESELPKLPPNAFYIQHENKCYDLGTIGWFLQNGSVNITNYKYFIFLNSSVRGPYIVSYFQFSQWYQPFTNRLNNYTKLVGPTISCQVSPHVQSYFWATDFEGLSLLMKNGRIFKCHETQVRAIYDAEIPASQVMFQAGRGIDSLMRKYQSVDFRQDKDTRGCFHLENPTSDKQVDGISLDPFEVVFIKLKYSTRDFQHVQSRFPTYDRWIG